MHPELEDFLENALGAVQPVAQGIGRVVVEPDYDVAPANDEGSKLATELAGCIRGQRTDLLALQSPQGFEAEIAAKYGLLKKYIRRITLHADSVEGPWVEVAPPGNWI